MPIIPSGAFVGRCDCVIGTDHMAGHPLHPSIHHCNPQSQCRVADCQPTSLCKCSGTHNISNISQIRSYWKTTNLWHISTTCGTSRTQSTSVSCSTSLPDQRCGRRYLGVLTVAYLRYPGPTLRALELLQEEQFRKDILSPEVMSRVFQAGLDASNST